MRPQLLDILVLVAHGSTSAAPLEAASYFCYVAYCYPCAMGDVGQAAGTG